MSGPIMLSRSLASCGYKQAIFHITHKVYKVYKLLRAEVYGGEAAAFVTAAPRAGPCRQSGTNPSPQ